VQGLRGHVRTIHQMKWDDYTRQHGKPVETAATEKPPSDPVKKPVMEAPDREREGKLDGVGTITPRPFDDRRIRAAIPEYVNILTDQVRWEIVRLLDSEPMDAELISSMLYRRHVTERPLSRQAVEKHLRQLAKIGVVMKKKGVTREQYGGLVSLMEREGIMRSKNQPVTLYDVVPEAIEAVLRSLTLKNYNVNVELKPKVERVRDDYEEYIKGFHRVRVLNGEDTGRIFRLRGDSIRIGRADSMNEAAYDPQRDIVLSSGYVAVSRVSKPHARLLSDNSGEWFIEHSEGANGTFLGHKSLEKNVREKLTADSVIDLAEPSSEGSARLVFLAPETPTS